MQAGVEVCETGQSLEKEKIEEERPIGKGRSRSRFSEDDIHQAIGILEVNGFEARAQSGSMVLCLYPKTSMLAHNCVPNTVHSIAPTNLDGDRYRLAPVVVVAALKWNLSVNLTRFILQDRGPGRRAHH